MRNMRAVWVPVVLGVLACWSVAHSQDAPPASPEKTAAEAKRNTESSAGAEHERLVHPYRLDFSVNELEDGRKINSRQYSLNLNADDANELKIGTRVPVEAGQNQFQYMDVGTSIWCRIGERADGVPLTVRAEISNFAIPEQAAGRDARPAIRQFRINASTLAVPGKPMIVGSVDDPNSKRQFQLEVTVSRLR